MNNIKLTAVGHRVIVKPMEVEEKTESGIIVAVNKRKEQQGTQMGTVIGVGPMAWKNELYGYGLEGWTPWCEVGDLVMFPRYGGKFICVNDSPTTKDEDREYVIVLNDEDIQCKVEEIKNA